MRFAPYGRAEGFTWTTRKLAFAKTRGARSAKRDQARYPLLAELVPAPVPLDIDLEAARRATEMRESEQRMRDLHSRVWREARHDFQRAAPAQRAAIRAAWQAWTGPVTSLYYRYIVDLHTGVMAHRNAAAKQRRHISVTNIVRTFQAQQTLELTV